MNNYYTYALAYACTMNNNHAILSLCQCTSPEDFPYNVLDNYVGQYIGDDFFDEVDIDAIAILLKYGHDFPSDIDSAYFMSRVTELFMDYKDSLVGSAVLHLFDELASFLYVMNTLHAYDTSHPFNVLPTEDMALEVLKWNFDEDIFNLYFAKYLNPDKWTDIDSERYCVYYEF
eukprot:TRINITY_DN334_c0_g4_i5.p1 TRINITY_DN334_c0_g4~~TRINITY_DN334_c0_g4_i5.p1  ORF type:complete len:174 (+),score=14.81 TRINITY_DN334_c0_g4_i5:958-1479(+)